MPEPLESNAIAIIVSRYNASVTGALREAAEATFAARGGSSDHLAVIEAPGVFELPAIVAAAIETGNYAGIVCLGCVIKGETPHDEHIARACAHALAELSARHAMPVAFGVITALNAEQAAARSGGHVGNKGEEAMAAMLDALEAIGAIRSSASPALRHEAEGAPRDKSTNIQGRS